MDPNGTQIPGQGPMEALEEMDKLFDTTVAAEGGGVSVPDGFYTVVLRKAALKPTNDGKGVKFVSELEVLAPSSVGKTIKKTSAVTASSMPYFKKELLTFGHTGNLTQLRDGGADALVGRVYAIAVKTSDRTGNNGEPLKNVFVNKLVSMTLEDWRADNPTLANLPREDGGGAADSGDFTGEPPAATADIPPEGAPAQAGEVPF